MNSTSPEVSGHLGGEIPAHDPQEPVAKAAPRLAAGKYFSVLHMNQQFLLSSQDFSASPLSCVQNNLPFPNL